METETGKNNGNDNSRRDKRSKFVALAQGRTINAIKAIRVIGNSETRLTTSTATPM